MLILRTDQITRSLLAAWCDEFVRNFYGRGLLLFHFFARFFNLLLKVLKFLFQLASAVDLFLDVIGV